MHPEPSSISSAAACPVCGSERLIDHDDLCECHECTHVFQWPANVTAKYDRNYLTKYLEYPLTQLSYLRTGYIRALDTGRRLLDVGHGTGDFVRAARRAGFDAFGFDVHGVELLGVPTIRALNNGMPWDVVTFFDSLEHFANLDAARELATRAQWIVVSMPHKPVWFPAVRNWKHYRPGEHLHYFTPDSLCRLFAGHHLVKSSNLEDAVRGSREGKRNIATHVFRRK